VGQASEIARNVSSTANEPMLLVPGRIARSLAHLLPTYLIAIEVASAA
jgi:hypothetical protein